MKKAAWSRLALLAAAVLLNTGCWVYSLHPLVEPKDSLSEPTLTGTWEREGEDKGTLTITPADPGYQVEYLDKKDGKTSKLRGALIQLGPNRFLDLDPHDNALEGLPEPVKAHLLPAHSFWKVTLSGDTLRLTPINAEWMEKGVKAKRLVIAHEMIDREVVLRAATPELRRFVQRYAGPAFPDKDAWAFRKK